MAPHPMSLGQHYQCPRLRGLDPVLKSWIRVLKRYYSIGDQPWNYRERTQIGFFAAAAWLSGHVALEEWSTQKGRKDARRKGRCDLWIDIADFHIEAKHKWCIVTRGLDKEMRYIEREMSAAVNNTADLNCSKTRRLAFLFLSPCLPPHPDRDFSAELDAWLGRVYRLRHDAIAWYFPVRRGLRSNAGGYAPVGACLLIRKP